MENNDKPKTVYTKAQIIKMAARSARIRKSVVEDVYNAIEEEIFKALSSADEKSDISIRLFEGITIDSQYIPEQTQLNNLTGRTITTLAKIKAKANITRHYCGKLFNAGKPRDE